MGDVTRKQGKTVEWPTLLLILACYVVWGAATVWLAQWSLVAACGLVALCLALFASLQHEVIHGHPFANQRVNEALVVLPLNLVIPFSRFRDTHLAHHHDAELTDPYDDPESNFLTSGTWRALPRSLQLLLRFNNTLLGRLLVGPVVSQVFFMRSEWACRHDGVLRCWGAHIAGVALVLGWVIWVSAMPLWAYLLAAYLSLSIVKIRTFLEHQAHERARGRSAIIEDRGLLAFLFLNNNLHAVHHMYPRVPWYRLPALYARSKARFQAVNDGYVYRSYGQVFAAHFFRPKDEVAHPLWHRD